MREHATLSRYQAGCRCEPCTLAQREYFRAYRIRKRAARGPSAPLARHVAERERSASWLTKTELVQHTGPEAMVGETPAARSLRVLVDEPRPTIVRGKVTLPPRPALAATMSDALAELVDCTRLRGRLTVRSCTWRWRIANRAKGGAGADAVERARLEACRRCPVGAERLEALRSGEEVK